MLAAGEKIKNENLEEIMIKGRGKKKSCIKPDVEGLKIASILVINSKTFRPAPRNFIRRGKNNLNAQYYP